MAGEVIEFQIQTFDVYGNPTVRGEDTFYVTVRGGGRVGKHGREKFQQVRLVAEVVSLHTGSFTVKYRVPIAGAYSVEVNYAATADAPTDQWRAVKGAPFSVTAVPAPKPAFSQGPEDLATRKKEAAKEATVAAVDAAARAANTMDNAAIVPAPRKLKIGAQSVWGHATAAQELEAIETTAHRQQREAEEAHEEARRATEAAARARKAEFKASKDIPHFAFGFWGDAGELLEKIQMAALESGHKQQEEQARDLYPSLGGAQFHPRLQRQRTRRAQMATGLRRTTLGAVGVGPGVPVLLRRAGQLREIQIISAKRFERRRKVNMQEAEEAAAAAREAAAADRAARRSRVNVGAGAGEVIPEGVEEEVADET